MKLTKLFRNRRSLEAHRISHCCLVIKWSFITPRLFISRLVMDKDTIFPSLSSGESVVGKYRFSERRARTETICILTNSRLLVRWRETFCLCLHQSSYSAIALNAIQRIDEARPNRYKLVTYAVALLMGLAEVITGFAVKLWYIWAIGFLKIAITLIFLFFYCQSLKKKFITLKGPFGSIEFKFDKLVAREFEARLSEMVYVSQAPGNNWQANAPGRSPLPSAPYVVASAEKPVRYSKWQADSLEAF